MLLLFQASAYVKFASILLARESHMVEPKVRQRLNSTGLSDSTEITEPQGMDTGRTFLGYHVIQSSTLSKTQ